MVEFQPASSTAEGTPPSSNETVCSTGRDENAPASRFRPSAAVQLWPSTSAVSKTWSLVVAPPFIPRSDCIRAFGRRSSRRPQAEARPCARRRGASTHYSSQYRVPRCKIRTSPPPAPGTRSRATEGPSRRARAAGRARGTRGGSSAPRRGGLGPAALVLIEEVASLSSIRVRRAATRRNYALRKTGKSGQQ